MAYLIGVDEVGTGSYAGPIMICGVRAPEGWSIPGLRDSKKLKRERRVELSRQLLALAEADVIQFRLEMATNEEIDLHSLGTCHKRCIATAINALYEPTDNVVIDGNIAPIHFHKYGLTTDLELVKSVIKADSKYPTVMAASIIAKHHRDTLMIAYHEQYPYYGWERNVGYLAAEHKAGIKEHGLCSLHRRSYSIK